MPVTDRRRLIGNLTTLAGDMRQNLPKGRPFAQIGQMAVSPADAAMVLDAAVGLRGILDARRRLPARLSSNPVSAQVTYAQLNALLEAIDLAVAE